MCRSVGFLASTEAAKIRAQLGWVLASAPFESAERSSAFLRFIVGERALERRTNEIKESIVAVEILGRKTSFDSKIDPIVRVEAKRLRDHLDSGRRTPSVRAYMEEMRDSL